MKLKWKHEYGSYFAISGRRSYTVRGGDGEWWSDYTCNYRGYNLGWSPTATMGKERCQALEDYYDKAEKKDQQQTDKEGEE